MFELKYPRRLSIAKSKHKKVMTHAEKFSDIVVNQETRAILPIQESLDKFRGLVTRTGKTNGAVSVCLSRARGESPG